MPCAKILSIIVTVYNLEKYLPACLDSILSQSEQDYEIVLVNNGSTDNSGGICNDYAKRYSQIRYFSLEGEPVMWRAHWHGLEKASGEYIWFVDGDDFLPKNACEIVSNAIRKTKTDVYFGRFSTFLEGNVSNFADSPYECEHINARDKDEAMDYLIKKQQPVLPTWRLIYSRKLYVDAISQEKFTKLMRNAHQDTGLNVLILILAKSIHYIDHSIYNYRVRETSISRTDPMEKILAYCKVLLIFAHLTHNLTKSDTEQGFVYAYYKQFLFLLSTIIGAVDLHWSQKICDDVDDFAKSIDLSTDNVLARDFSFAEKLFSHGTNIALSTHKNYCRNKIEIIADLLKDKGGVVYLAPTGNVGIFLKTAFEQEGLKIAGFFDNDKAKDGMEIAGAIVRPPPACSELPKNQPITILIGASYASVPKQLKQQFISFGVAEEDLIIIEF